MLVELGYLMEFYHFVNYKITNRSQLSIRNDSKIVSFLPRNIQVHINELEELRHRFLSLFLCREILSIFLVTIPTIKMKSKYHNCI